MGIRKIDNLTIRIVSFKHPDGEGHTNVGICEEENIARLIHIRKCGESTIDGITVREHHSEFDIEIPLNEFLEHLGLSASPIS